MTEPSQSAELQLLREQLAQLTRRVYELEQRTGGRTPTAAGSVSPSAEPKLKPVPPSSVTSIAGPEPEASRSAVNEASVLASLGQTVHSREQAPPSATGISLESRIGGQWLNRVGIIAVLVGLSYFLKLAIENNWIGPGPRVVIGLLAGIALLMWSERFRRSGFAGFAFSLKATGIGALYLSLWAAFQFYHLVPAIVAFAGMVLVTVISTVLSLRQNAELLAALALLGGFLTPVLVSTNQNHAVTLFCYLALLDLGTVWVVATRGWRRLLLASFIGTALLYGAWAAGYYTEAQLGTAFAFASFFFLLYAGAPLLAQPSTESQSSTNAIIALTLLNAASYFAASYVMLLGHHRAALAWLAVGLAIFFLALTRVPQRYQQPTTSFYAPLYLALAVGFLTIAIPLKLGSYWNTLGWIVEAGALFWASYRTRGVLLRVLGLCALLLGVIRLIAVDTFAPGRMFFNPRFGLYVAAIASLAVLSYYDLKERSRRDRSWSGAAILAINVLALLALHFEIVDYFQPQFAAAYSTAELHSVATVKAFTYSAVWMLYGSVLMIVGFWRRSAFLRWQAIALLALTVVKVFIFDIGTLERGYRIAAFMVLGAILLAVSFFYQRSRIKTVE